MFDRGRSIGRCNALRNTLKDWDWDALVSGVQSSEQTIARVAETRFDVAAIVEAVIERGREDRHVRIGIQNRLDPDWG